jgi:hypothetical protein
MSSLTLVHLTKVPILLNYAIGKHSTAEPSTTGILAVSKVSPTSLVSDRRSVNDENDCTNLSDVSTIHIQVVFLFRDDDDEKNIAATCNGKVTTSSQVASYSAKYTMEQISNELKVFDGNTLQQEHVLIGTVPLDGINDIHENKTSTGCPTESQKVEYWISLLKNATSENRPESKLNCFTVLELKPYTDNANNEQVRLHISIKERLSNGIVRILWSTLLLRVEDNIINNKKNSSDVLFDLSLQLTEQNQQSNVQLATVQDQYHSLERDRDGWKDTAEKLEGKWEEEKSILFQNFCTLYTNKQEYDQAKIEQLQEEIIRLKEQFSKSTTSKNNALSSVPVKKSELPECLQDLPNDDNHCLPYDDDMVRRLAQGQRVPIVSIKTEDTSDNDINASNTARQKRRRNPVSGATEYIDADDALQDILKVPPPHTNKKVRTAPKRTKRSQLLDIAKAAPKQTQVKTTSRAATDHGSDSETGSDDDFVDKKLRSAPKRTERSQLLDIAKTAPKKTQVKTTSRVATDHGSDSETGSDDDFVDKDMQAQIMADLEALRQA